MKTHIAHTEPLLKNMKQVKLSDIYTCYFLKLYYKLYGDYTHNPRNDLIRLPTIRCKFGAMNAKYQIHLRLRELANPSNPLLYPPILINVDTLNMSAQRFSDYLKTEVIKSDIDVYIIDECYVCDHSN